MFVHVMSNHGHLPASAMHCPLSLAKSEIPVEEQCDLVAESDCNAARRWVALSLQSQGVKPTFTRSFDTIERYIYSGPLILIGCLRQSRCLPTIQRRGRPQYSPQNQPRASIGSFIEG